MKWWIVIPLAVALVGCSANREPVVHTIVSDYPPPPRGNGAVVDNIIAACDALWKERHPDGDSSPVEVCAALLEWVDDNTAWVEAYYPL